MEKTQNGQILLPGGGMWLRKVYSHPVDSRKETPNSVGSFNPNSQIGGGGASVLALPLIVVVLLVFKFIVFANSGSKAIANSHEVIMRELSKSNNWEKSTTDEGPNWQFHRDSYKEGTPFSGPSQNESLERLLMDRKDDVIDIGIDLVDGIDDDDEK